MAITFVSAGAVAVGSNPTLTVPTGYAADDLLLIITTGPATPSTPSGWTSYYAQGIQQRITVLYKTASTSESSVALSIGGSTSKSVMVAYRGVKSFDAISAIATGNSASATPNTLTTTVVNDYILDIYASSAGTALTWTASAFTTARVNSAAAGGATGLLLTDELQTSVGTSTARTASLSASTTWGSIAIALQPAPVSGGTFLSFFL